MTRSDRSVGKLEIGELAGRIYDTGKTLSQQLAGLLSPSSTEHRKRYISVRTTTPGDRSTGEPDDAESSPTMIPVSAESSQPRQLSALDAQLLDAESPTMLLHVGSVTILAPPGEADAPLTIAELRQLIADRLHLVAPLRWRLRTVPLGLDLPYWEDCSAIDLGYHVRAAHLPGGATDSQLADLVARLHATPLDRTRPQWECHLISGLEDGRQALYTKVHHAVIDGVSGAEIMAALLDVVAEAPHCALPMAGIRLDPKPTMSQMLSGSLTHTVTRQIDRVKAPLRLGPALRQAVADIRVAHRELPFTAPNTAERAFAFVSLSLDDVKKVKNSFGGTVNDVVMALCAGALRRWLVDHAAEPEKPLLAAVPVSVRTAEQFGTAGNHFSIMLCPLPIDEPDAQHRLKLTHTALSEVKERFRAASPTVLHDMTSVLPPVLHGLTTRTLLRLGAPAMPLADVIISNVPGPQFPLYAAGHRVMASHPVSVLTDLTGGSTSPSCPTTAISTSASSPARTPCQTCGSWHDIWTTSSRNCCR